MTAMHDEEHEHHHHEHDHDHDHHDHDHHDHDHEHGHHEHRDEFGNIHVHDDDPAEEGSRLHLEIHRAVDELGKYAIEMRIQSEEGIPKESLKGFVDDLMRASTEECFEHGADLIGHVKSFVKVGDDSIMCSMVDISKPTNIQDNISDTVIHDALFVLHVIVHGIWDDEIRHSTLEVLPDVAKKWGIEYTVLADYFDTEKSIAHHEK